MKRAMILFLLSICFFSKAQTNTEPKSGVRFGISYDVMTTPYVITGFSEWKYWVISQPMIYAENNKFRISLGHVFSYKSISAFHQLAPTVKLNWYTWKFRNNSSLGFYLNNAFIISRYEQDVVRLDDNLTPHDGFAVTRSKIYRPEMGVAYTIGKDKKLSMEFGLGMATGFYSEHYSLTVPTCPERNRVASIKFNEGFYPVIRLGIAYRFKE